MATKAQEFRHFIDNDKYTSFKMLLSKRFEPIILTDKKGNILKVSHNPSYIFGLTRGGVHCAPLPFQAARTFLRTYLELFPQTSLLALTNQIHYKRVDFTNFYEVYKKPQVFARDGWKLFHKKLLTQDISTFTAEPDSMNFITYYSTWT
jgi:hypothetical protein